MTSNIGALVAVATWMPPTVRLKETLPGRGWPPTSVKVYAGVPGAALNCKVPTEDPG